MYQFPVRKWIESSKRRSPPKTTLSLQMPDELSMKERLKCNVSLV